jgi:hypothetical protein
MRLLKLAALLLLVVALFKTPFVLMKMFPLNHAELHRREQQKTKGAY